MSLGIAFESLRLEPIPVCSLCFMLVVQDVSSQCPAPGPCLPFAAMLPGHDELLSSGP